MCDYLQFGVWPAQWDSSQAWLWSHWKKTSPFQRICRLFAESCQFLVSPYHQNNTTDQQEVSFQQTPYLHIKFLPQLQEILHRWYLCIRDKLHVCTHYSSAVGRFHVKGPRKKVNIEKWIFLNEMWKMMGQLDDLDCFLNNSCNLGFFLAKNQNYPKITVLKMWILKKKMFFF